MKKTSQDALRAAVMRLLRPLIHLLLRHGVSYDAFADLAKRVYVNVAIDDFGIEGRKQTASRVSILTGLTRKEVARVQALSPAEDNAAQERYHRAARVVAGWVRDADFADKNGAPAVLSVNDGAASFSALVRRYSGDMPVRAVLDELVRVGVAALESDGRVRLLARAYIPEASDVDKLQILGSDVADLIRTIDHNIQRGLAEPLFQRKAMYDNLPLEALPRLRALGAKQAQRLIEQADAWLSEKDRDVTPVVEGTGRARAGIGIFYFEEVLDPGKPEKKS